VKSLGEPEEEKSKEDAVKRLVGLKSYLEERVRELEQETQQLRGFLDVVDEVVIAKSFQRAEVAQKPAEEYRQAIPLKTKNGVLLAVMHVGDYSTKIVPAEDIKFDTNTPPFQAFLINRVLEPMQTQDKDGVLKGEVEPDKTLSFEVVKEDDLIKEIMIRNYGSEKRLNEIKSSVRWTLDKMYEKVHGPA
jgi:hypothetical protein